MNPNSYLTNIIKKYSITGEERVVLHRKVRPVYRDIRKWAGEYLLKIIPSGSFLKGTSIRGNVDIDLLFGTLCLCQSDNRAACACSRSGCWSKPASYAP